MTHITVEQANGALASMQDADFRSAEDVDEISDDEVAPLVEDAHQVASRPSLTALGELSGSSG